METELHQHDLAMEREQELKEKNKKREYFWDFNTVEQVLLSCAILVCLSGVMFESDRFSNDKANRYIWQRTFLTYCVILVVIFSLCYYFAVFMSEVMGYTPGWVKKCLAKRQRGMHLHLSQLVADGDRKNEEANNSKQKMHFDKSGRRRGNSRLLEVEMADLAAQGATGSAVTNPLQRRVHQAEKKAEKKNDDDDIEDEISLAVKDESERTEDAWNSSRSTTNAQKSKKGFGQTIARGSAAGVTGDALRLGGLGVDSSRGSKKKLKSKRGKNKKSVKKKKIVQKEEEPPSPSSKKIQRQDSKRRPSFRAHKHEETGQEYYQNEDTGETQWTVPEDAEIIGRPKQSKQRKSIEKKEFHQKKIHTKEDEDVQVHVDPKSKRRYSYSNKSGSTEWLDDDEEEEEEEKEKDSEWEMHVDPTTKRRYSAHVKTGETKWEDEHPDESTAATVQRYQDQETGAWYEVDADGNTKWL